MDRKDNRNVFLLDQYFDEITPPANDNQTKLPSNFSFEQIYQKEFLNFFHCNYYGQLQDEELFLASIRDVRENGDQQFISAIVRTSKESSYLHCPWPNYPVDEDENLLSIVFNELQLGEIQSFKAIRSIRVNEKIAEFDRENDRRQSFKIALLCQFADQIDGDELFSNDNLSLPLEHFLNTIADRVQLKDFAQYRGDLDTKSNEHGEYSYFTIFDHYQMMFNIAPIIPCDQQLIERKRLVANSFLCLIFQENEHCQFHPERLNGKVVQVYITIQPMTIDEQLYYKINIWRRAHLKGTNNPRGGIYKSDESFRRQFLMLIVQIMNDIFQGDFLHGKIFEQKQRVKSEHLIRLFSTFDLYQLISDSNDDQTNHRTERRRRKLTSRYSLKTSQDQHSSVRPRLTGALNKIKPKFRFSSSQTSLSSMNERSLNTDDQPTIDFQSKSIDPNSIQTEIADSLETQLCYSPLYPTLSLVTNTLHSMTFDKRKSPVFTLADESVNEGNIFDQTLSHDDELQSD